MRRLTALGALILFGFLGAALSAPGADLGLPVPAITTVSHADAAVGRGGGEGEGGGGGGGQIQVLTRIGQWFERELPQAFFPLVALGLGWAALQRNAGAAVGILVGAVVIGAFILAPDKVESLFRAIYQFVL